MSYFIIPVIALILIFLIFGTFFIVKQQSAAVVERFGKYTSVRQSGLQIKIPIIDSVSGRLSLRIQQLDVVVETKTKDDVFVKVKVSVQYKVIKDKVYDAFYKLDFPQDQITSYVFDVVRAEVPKMILDDVFEKKDDIAIAVKGELNEAMKNYGFDIIKTLVTDIDPDSQVKESMNRINASEREKVAAQFEGDAQRILIVERAKAATSIIEPVAKGEIKIELGHNNPPETIKNDIVIPQKEWRQLLRRIKKIENKQMGRGATSGVAFVILVLLRESSVEHGRTCLFTCATCHVYCAPVVS